MVEVENELAAHGFHTTAGGLDLDAFAFDEEAEFGEGILDAGEHAFEIVAGLFELAGGDSKIFEAEDGADFQEVFELVVLALGDEALLFPGREHPGGNLELPEHVGACPDIFRDWFPGGRHGLNGRLG